ncbi:hypothetical protein SEPCBS119000_003926 [Sporothrix epigloea]|uniref:Uncharacterized protein n=1 Tax=Sporothrix epigloea TaxID=1892477 RepID=A0ABP0DT24_9PEZI
MNGATSTVDTPPSSTQTAASTSEAAQASAINGSASNTGSLKKRKMDIKPIITTEDQELQKSKCRREGRKSFARKN